MPLSTPLDDDMIRELFYCNVPLGGGRLGGQVGAAQDRLLAAHLLEPKPGCPRYLVPTRCGRARLASLPARAA